MMRTKKQANGESRLATFCIYTVIVLLCALCLYPMYYVLIMSISDPIACAAHEVFLYPKGFSLEAYAIVGKDMRLWRSYSNTIIYVALTTVLMLLTCVMGAYPLTSPQLAGKKFVNMFLLLTMYFSGGLIPTYILMTNIGLYDNIWALIIPGCFSVWYVILVRSYFASIPETMREAAKIDGANNFQILFKLYVPTAKPIIAVIAIYTIVNVWNSWFNANVYLPNEAIQPLQLYLRRILVEQTEDLTSKIMTIEQAAAAAEKRLTNNQLQYAVIVYATLPLIFTYPFFQKHFAKGVMVGSLKG